MAQLYLNKKPSSSHLLTEGFPVWLPLVDEFRTFLISDGEEKLLKELVIT